MAQGRYYVESGRYDAKGMATMVAGAVGAGAAAGAVYGPLDQVNPFIYINLIGCFLVAFAICLGTGMAGRAGKVRSSPMAGVAGVVGGLVALWVAWVSWCWALSGWELWLWDPGVLWSFVQMVGEKGAWSLRSGDPVSGWPLWTIWTVEAGVIVAGAAFASWSQLADEPFCERCQVWAGEEATADLAPVQDGAGLVRTLEGGDYAALLALPRVPATDPLRLAAKVVRCTARPDCPRWLTLSTKARTKNSKGEDEESSTVLATNLVVPPEVYEFVRTPPAPGKGEGQAPA